MRQATSSAGRGNRLGCAIALAVLLAAGAGGLWLVLRIAPPVPWQVDLGRLAHNLVPFRPEDLSHRRASGPQRPAPPRGETSPQSGETP